MVKKKIVIINQDSGYLMVDMAQAFLGKGYEVNLITGRLVERNNKLDPRIHLKRIIPYDRSSSFKRLFTWLVGTVQIMYLLKTKFLKEHILFVSNPPTTIIIPKFIKNTFDFLIYDIYPDVLIESKMVSENSIVIKQWKALNQSVFKRANRIFTLNDQMKKVLFNYCPKDKIEVIPIWTDNEFLKPIEKHKNEFIAAHNMLGKFIVLYSGNLGRTHNIEQLIDVAKLIEDDEIQFLIIGGGDQFENIKNRVQNERISNIMVLPWVEPKEFPLSLNSADIGIVSLGKGASKLSIPSKTYNMMSVGIPILGLTEQESALAKLIDKNEIGKSFTVYQTAEIADFILKLKENAELLEKYKKKSLHISRQFDKSNAYKFVS